MPRLAPLKPLEVEKILLKNGFIYVNTVGSHKHFSNRTTKAHTTIPFHSQDLPTGTLRSIVRQSQLPINLFRR